MYVAAEQRRAADGAVKRRDVLVFAKCPPPGRMHPRRPRFVPLNLWRRVKDLEEAR